MNAESLGQSTDIFSGSYMTSYFKHDFEKFQYCSHQIMKLQFDKKYFYGDEVLLDLYRNGDVVTAAYLQLTFTTPGITVVNSLGTYAIEYIQLEYDTHVIETLYGEYMEMELDLHVPQGKQGALGQLVGKNRTTMNSTYSIKLPFDCFRKGFPVCALKKNPVIRFKFRKASEFAPSIITPLQLNATLLVDYAFLPQMQKEYIQTHRLDYLVEQTHRATSTIPALSLGIANKTANVNMTSNVSINLANSSYSFNVNVPYDYYSAGTSNITFVASVTDVSPSLSNYTVLVNGTSVSRSGTVSSSAATIIYSSDLLRGATANVTIQWNTNVTLNTVSCTFSGMYITNETKPWTVFTNFELPTKEIFYVIQNTTSAPYDYTYDGTWDQFASMRLMFNGQEVIPFSLGTPMFMRQLQGLENYTRTPDRYFYVYAFSLDPENIESSGSVNLSRITRQQHDFILRAPISDRQLRIYTRVYNFMRIENGEAIIAHELKTSDILDRTITLPPWSVINLATTNPQQTTMGLTWTSAIGATSYSIVSSPATTTQTTTNPSSYTFTGLSAGTSYTFTVTSINANGASGSATSSAVSTLSAAVTNLVTTNPQLTTIGLTWTSAVGATSYSIVSSPATTTQTTTNPSSYTFTGLSTGTSYTFTVTSINASGVGGSATSSAASTLSTFTFTTLGASGATGPTSLAPYGTTYPGYGTATPLTLSGGIQYWTVITTGTYNFTVAGAGSFHTASSSAVKVGYGAVLTASYNLTAGQVIAILVGQQGINNADGAGGTFVVSLASNTSPLSTAVPLFVAGGAGGPGGEGGLNDNINASLTTSGRNGAPSGSVPVYAGAGGTGGNGGKVGTAAPNAHIRCDGGGGFLTDGGWSQIYGSITTAPKAFINGGTGGTNTGSGGFGGGAGFGGYANREGGGGGGYSGGGAGDTNGQGAAGGGGGSYDITGVYSGSATNSGSGYVTIVY